MKTTSMHHPMRTVRLLFIASLALGGCDKFSQKISRDQRGGLIDGIGAPKTVSAQIDQSGAITARMSANSPFTQEVRAGSDGALNGTVLSFPPGSLGIDTEIMLEESVPLANASLGATLGLGGSLTPSSSAVAVLPKTALDPVAPFTIAITLSENAGLKLNDGSLVVVYKVKIFAEDKNVAGVIPTSAITLEGNTVKFSARYFGAFQAAYSSLPVNEEKKAEVSTPIQSKREVASLAALQISKRSRFLVRPGDTVQLSGQNFRPTMTLALGHTPIKDANIASDTTVSFTVPTSSIQGLAQLTVDQDGVSQAVALFYSAAKLDYPMSSMVPAEMCNGVRYYDTNGILQTGSKPCVVESCTASRTVSCMASDAFPAVEKATLPIASLRAGVFIANREGTLADCASDGAQGCVTSANFKAANMTGLASKVLYGQTVAGVTGTAPAETHAACTASIHANCVASANFPSIDPTQIPQSMIRVNTTIAGVTGTIADCSTAGSDGCYVSSPLVAANPTTISPWDLRRGRSIAGIIGSLKTTCRNTGTQNDPNTPLGNADTIDDFQNGGSFPVDSPWNADDHLCGDVDTGTNEATANWIAVDQTGCNTSPTDPMTCYYKDKITNLLWTASMSAMDWTTATTTSCATPWRLPTQKEMLDAYNHGIRRAASLTTGWIDPSAIDAEFFWSATTDSTNNLNAWQVHLAKGQAESSYKTSAAYVTCVNDAP
jgi:hypothetical protein